MAHRREVIITAAHPLTHGLPLRLRATYPAPPRGILQTLRLHEVTMHTPQDAERTLAVPTALGRFGRKAPSIAIDGIGEPLPAEAPAFGLVLDYLHDSDAFTFAGRCFGLKIRLRYDVDNDRLEGTAGYWNSPIPDGSTLRPPEAVLSGSFHLTYAIPY